MRHNCKPHSTAQQSRRSGKRRLNVLALQNSTPILRKLVQGKQIQVVGGVYDLDTGKVNLITV